MEDKRFRDENKVISEFHKEALVKCLSCGKKAIAKVNDEKKLAEMICFSCGYNKRVSMEYTVMGMKTVIRTAANAYFDAQLWLQHPFKNNVFWVYNAAHLEYLERYISAGLREHKDRSHYTLIEKLPRFYHEAKNREALLKIISRLKQTI